MQLYLVRHGESASNIDKSVLSTVPNHLISLTPKGKIQAMMAGVLLNRIGVFEAPFIMSPHVRTLQTAERMQTHVNATSFKEDYLIREVDIGNFIHDFESIRQDRLKIGKFNYRFPNGENMADVVFRVERFLDKLAKTSYEEVVIVTHAGTINAFRMIIEGLTVAQFDMLPKPENGKIFITSI